MIFDSVPFSALQAGGRSQAVNSFLGYLQKKLGVIISYDARTIPFSRPKLLKQFELAQTLQDAGIISTFYPSERFCDDPPITLWAADCTDHSAMKTGGISWDSDADALTAALAEALERYIWKEQTDYFKNPIRASVREMESCRKVFIALERFAGFAKTQRAVHAELSFDADTLFLWIEGVSLVSGKRIYLPAQTVSGAQLPREPIIRSRNTTGLATWPTKAGAQLAGAMECIERDAYMVMWLNQLTLPKLNTKEISEKYPSLAPLIDSCERYRFKVHIVPLLTDAPAHAVMTVLEDLSPEPPRFAIGLKAHRSLEHAIEKSLLEALRAHRSGRRMAAKGSWDTSVAVKDIGHYERTHYWTLPEHARHLEFLIAGKEQDIKSQPWDNETIEQHLARVAAWCREKGYECVSVPLTRSAKNPTKLHVEMVVIPELHPMHLYEKDLGADPSRLQSVPQQFGFMSRKEAFAERPHPFA